MRIDIGTNLDELGPILATALGLPVEPSRLMLRDGVLRVEAQFKVFGRGIKTVVLTSQVRSARGQLSLTDFAIEGAVLNDVVLGMLREKLAGVDERRDPLRVKGTSGGESVVVSWMS